MTRKDYIAIAQAVKDARSQAMHDGFTGNDVEATLERIAGKLAAVCAKDNAQFDPKRFFTACGLYTGN